MSKYQNIGIGIGIGIGIIGILDQWVYYVPGNNPLSKG